MVRKLAHNVSTLFLFLIIMFSVARLLANPEDYINHDIAKKTAKIISGDINAESLYDAFFYIDFFTVLTITILTYLITMNFLKRRRNK